MKTVIHAAAISLLVFCEATLGSTLCTVSGDNYIVNADFTERSRSDNAKHWTGIQHAGESSFERVFDGDVLQIIKIGSQPWFLLRQKLHAQQLLLAGKKVAFSAEIKLDMQPPAIYMAFKVGGGLQLTAKSKSSNKILLRSTLDHEPHMGKSDWQEVQVVVRLPKKAGVIDLDILHQADGQLSIRRPSLRLVDESEGPCKLTPRVKS
jgi:hypothetical protein